MISRRGQIPRSGIQDGLLEGMKGRFDWNWRIARGLLISTRWILMKKRLETDGESSSWNIVLHLPSLSSFSFSLSLSLSRARALPRIFFSPSFSRPDPFFIRRPRWTHEFHVLIYQITTFLVISIRFLAFPIRSFVFSFVPSFLEKFKS